MVVRWVSDGYRNYLRTPAAGTRPQTQPNDLWQAVSDMCQMRVRCLPVRGLGEGPVVTGVVQCIVGTSSTCSLPNDCLYTHHTLSHNRCYLYPTLCPTLRSTDPPCSSKKQKLKHHPSSFPPTTSAQIGSFLSGAAVGGALAWLRRHGR